MTLSFYHVQNQSWLKDTHALINFQYYEYTKYQQLTWAVLFYYFLSFNIGKNETTLLYRKRGRSYKWDFCDSVQLYHTFRNKWSDFDHHLMASKAQSGNFRRDPKTKHLIFKPPWSNPCKLSTWTFNAKSLLICNKTSITKIKSPHVQIPSVRAHWIGMNACRQAVSSSTREN